MAAETLSGSSFPLKRGGFVVTVECPNAYSHQRLMQALNTIVPEAGDPIEPPKTAIPVLEEDEIPGYRCANGACAGD